MMRPKIKTTTVAAPAFFSSKRLAAPRVGKVFGKNAPRRLFHGGDGCPVLYPGAGPPMILAAGKLLNRVTISGPVTKCLATSALSGTMLPLRERT
jgi:hypothetical protein